MRASSTLLGLTLLGLLAVSRAAGAQTDAIPASVSGNQTFTGTLSQEFMVYGGPVHVTRLGAFDGDGDGFVASAPLGLGHTTHAAPCRRCETIRTRRTSCRRTAAP